MYKYQVSQMNKTFIFFFLLLSSILFAQKKYHFDYAFSVKESYKLNDQKFNSVFLVSSSNNNFNLYAHNSKDSLNFSMHFIDQDGVSINSKMSKTDFYNAEIISNTCTEVFRYKNHFIEKGTEYKFINYSDTIINDTSYYHYAIKSNKKLNYQKRKKIVSTHFIVDKLTPNFLPFTYFATIYETWKISKIIPNGIPKIIYFIDANGEKTGSMEITKIKVDKYVTIPNECDFTRKDIEDNLSKILKKAKFRSDYPSINY